MKKIIFLLTATTLLIAACNTSARKTAENAKTDSIAKVDSLKKASINKFDTLLVTDIDGNVYHTVKIGSQVWMAENLKVKHYRNGDAITNITDDIKWKDLINGAYCNYDNDSSNVHTYGRLYNWYAVHDDRNICPKGWHIPTDIEWTFLINYLGGLNVAGSKMKESGSNHWIYDSNKRSDNLSSFTGLPGGLRSENGGFFAKGGSGLWWSFTENNETLAWVRFLGSYDNDEIARMTSNKFHGLSVRCLKDQ